MSSCLSLENSLALLANGSEDWAGAGVGAVAGAGAATAAEGEATAEVRTLGALKEVWRVGARKVGRRVAGWAAVPASTQHSAGS